MIPMLFFALGSYLFVTEGHPIYLGLGGLIVYSQLAINSFGVSKQRIMYEHIMKTRKINPNFVTSSLKKGVKNRFIFYMISFVNKLSSFEVLVVVLIFAYIFKVVKYTFLFYVIYYCSIVILKVIVELMKGFRDYGLE